jgi:hypothetical protein
MHILKTWRLSVGPVFRRAAALTVIILVALFAGACGAGQTEATESAKAHLSGASGTSFVTPSSTSGCPSPACSAILAEVAAGAATDTVPSDLAPSLQDAAKDMRRPDGGDCSPLPIPDDPVWDPCTFSDGVPATAPMMVLVGDSQAWMWSRPMKDLAQQLGYRFGLIYHAACKLPDLTFNPGHGYTDDQCRQWKDVAIDWLNQQNPAVVLIASEHPHSNRYTDAQYAAGYAATIKRLQAPGRKLFVMGNPPILGQDPPRCLAGHPSSALKCAAATTQAAPTHEQQATLDAAQQTGAGFVNLIPLSCTEKLCPAIVGKYGVYQDQFHLTTTFAEHILPVVQQALGLGPA